MLAFKQTITILYGIFSSSIGFAAGLTPLITADWLVENVDDVVYLMCVKT